ncbi:MAG: malonate decarboxylase subunit alpha [Candidatus Bathyarchaeia archaeon]
MEQSKVKIRVHSILKIRVFMKVLSAEEAVSLIKDGATVVTGGFTTTKIPYELLHALRERFMKTGHPRDLTVVAVAGQSGGKGIGLDVLGVEGLMRRHVFSHCGKAPSISDLIMNNKIIAYCLPQGVLSQLMRDIAAKKPCLITHVGLMTFVDPRIEGGKVNELTKKEPDIVHLIEINGREYLRYDTFPIDVALKRGTTADEKGNISVEKEGVTLEDLSIAQAARNSGGIVIVQVERIVKAESICPRLVSIPHILVDYVVIASKPEYQWQTCRIPYDPAISGVFKSPISKMEIKPLDAKKIIARRGLMEIRKGDIVNLGIGTSALIADVAREEQVFEEFTLTVESGVIGGIPLGGVDFGVGINYADERGNVNVSKFGGRFVGCGGFIDISQNAKKVVFCGTFTTKDLEIKIEDGKLRILKEGKVKKFVKEVEHITFSGDYARKVNQKVLYITERAVFSLEQNGVVLKEVAPGIDIDKHILPFMEFEPKIAKDLREMDQRIFKEGRMNLTFFENSGGS